VSVSVSVSVCVCVLVSVPVSCLETVSVCVFMSIDYFCGAIGDTGLVHAPPATAGESTEAVSRPAFSEQ